VFVFDPNGAPMRGQVFWFPFRSGCADADLYSCTCVEWRKVAILKELYSFAVMSRGEKRPDDIEHEHDAKWPVNQEAFVTFDPPGAINVEVDGMSVHGKSTEIEKHLRRDDCLDQGIWFPRGYMKVRSVVV